MPSTKGDSAPLRLCVVSQWRFDDLSRIPGKPISEARRMSRNLERVVFVCYNEQGKFLSRRLSEKLFVYTVPLRMTHSLIGTLLDMLRQFIVMSIFLSYVVRKHRIDFIRAENVILGGIPAIIASTLNSIGYFIYLAGFEERVISIRYGTGFLSQVVRLVFRFLKTFILRKAKYMIGVSSELLAENKKYSAKPFIITPNFVDLEAFVPAPEKSEFNKPIRFVYAGRLEHEKGAEVLLDALKILGPRKDYEMRIAGWGIFLQNFLKLKKKGFNINYLGKLPHTEIPEVFQDADVLILPSLTEGMPAVVLEAFATGTPVIVTSVGQVPYVVEEGRHGFLIAPGKPIVLAAAMMDAINDSESMAKMSQEVRRRAEEISGPYVALNISMLQKYGTMHPSKKKTHARNLLGFRNRE